MRALSEDYLTTQPQPASIAWICNHSRNTQLALLHDYIDIALTYERAQESIAADEGWSTTVGCAFHDHFCLAGPVSDPANIGSSPSVYDALLRIAETKSLFHSRADASATMWKEQDLWSRCGLAPWEEGHSNVISSPSLPPSTDTASTSSEWYQTTLYTPSEALITADTAGAYLLTDRSTLLRQTSLQNVHQTTVFFEPTSSDDVLVNSCYALISPREENTMGNATEIKKFLEYMFSERGQTVIATFGRDTLGGFSLFAPMKDGFARTFLRGGRPKHRKWIVVD